MSKFSIGIFFILIYHAASGQLLEEKRVVPAAGRIFLSAIDGDTNQLFGAGYYKQNASTLTQAMFLRYHVQTGQVDAYQYQGVTNTIDDLDQLEGHGIVLKFKNGVAWALVDTMGTVLRVTYDSINFFYYQNNGIAVTPDTALLVCWSKNPDGEIFVGRFNTAFQPEWTRKVILNSNAGFSNPVFTVCDDNSFLVCADYIQNQTAVKLMLIKFDASGRLQWYRIFNRQLQSKQILPAAGGYVLTGTINNPSGLRNIAVINFDSTGAMTASRLFYDPIYNQYFPKSTVLFQDSLLVINGTYFDQTDFFSLIATVGLTGTGNMRLTTYEQWLSPINCGNMIETGGELFVPFECVQNSSTSNQFLVRTDDPGLVCSGSAGTLAPQSFTLQSDTGSLSEDTVHTDFILFNWPFVKDSVTAAAPAACAVGINETVPVHQVMFFPNPASGIVHIAWNMPPPEETRLYLHAADGRLLESFSDAGKLQQLDLSKYPAGLYFIRLSGPDAATTEKIVLRH